jgi:hypothetical protein
MRVWQIACGESGRYYDDLFLDHDVMFLGPGRPGPFNPTNYARAAAEGEITKHSALQVQRFFQDVQPDDMVLLRKGYRVLSIGVAREMSCYWLEEFDDVYGWDLQHCRRVQWQRHLDGQLDAIQAKHELFEDRKQIPTFTRVEDATVLNPVEPFLSKCSSAGQLKPLPKVPKPIGLEELGVRLFALGLPNHSVDQVIAALQRQRRLVGWYAAQGDAAKRPSEHEVVAHMVLPLMLALGWSEQLLAVEWNRIDLAAFAGTPTTAERCVLLCEAKHVGRGLQNVWEQARGYVTELGLVGCRKILLTEGARFYLYERDDKAGWPDRPTGYLNVEKIREDHVAPKGTSAVDTIVALTPMNLMRT